MSGRVKVIQGLADAMQAISEPSTRAIPSAFERQLRALIAALGWKWERFAPHDPFTALCTEHMVSKSTLNNIFRGKQRLRSGIAATLALRLVWFIESAQGVGRPEDLARRLRAHGFTEPIGFVGFEKGRFTIDTSALLRLANSSTPDADGLAHSTSSKMPPLATARARLVSITSDRDIEQWSDEDKSRVLEVLRQRGVSGFNISRIVEGCTTITFELPAEDAERLMRAFEDGALAEAGVIGLTSRDVPLVSSGRFGRALFSVLGIVPSRTQRADGAWAVDFEDGYAPIAFARGWQAALRREAFRRPWRRFRWLLSPHVRFSPLMHVIAESDRRSYAVVTAGDDERFRRLKTDLVTAWLVWPCLTVALLVLTIVPLRSVFPSIDAMGGVAAGLALSLAGAQICASVVSPLAVGAGGVALGWSFGVAQAIVIGQFGTLGPLSREAVREDYFVAVTGGPIGLSATAWRDNFQPSSIALMLAATALSIALAGWLMAQPRKAAFRGLPLGEQHAVRSHRRTWLRGTVYGVLVGAFIGLTFGLTQLLQRNGLTPPTAFTTAFAFTGSLAFGGTVWMRTGNRRRTAVFATIYALVAVAVCTSASAHAGTLGGLVALAGASGLYHATWFTGAFVVAGRFGTDRAAVAAATIEGAIGFTAFVLWRVMQP
jgi:hypothetical protein